MFVLYYIRMYMIYKSKNNKYSQKLIHINAKDSKKEKTVINHKRYKDF